MTIRSPALEDPAGIDLPLEDVGQEILNVRADGRGGLDQVPDGYRAMNQREAIKVMSATNSPAGDLTAHELASRGERKVTMTHILLAALALGIIQACRYIARPRQKVAREFGATEVA